MGSRGARKRWDAVWHAPDEPEPGVVGHDVVMWRRHVELHRVAGFDVQARRLEEKGRDRSRFPFGDQHSYLVIGFFGRLHVGRERRKAEDGVDLVARGVFVGPGHAVDLRRPHALRAAEARNRCGPRARSEDLENAPSVESSVDAAVVPCWSVRIRHDPLPTGPAVLV